MSEANYTRQIRSAVRGLYKGVLSLSDFRSAMKSTITRGMTQAWTEGAKVCGIAFDELSEAEVEALNQITLGQFEYIEGFRDFVKDKAEDKEGRLNDAFTRAELWINRYGEARNQAKAMACADQKLIWRINARCKEHCGSCTRLNGKVKRGSYWQKTILPRSRDLECGGWRCCCELQPTSEPLTKGRLSFL